MKKMSRIDKMFSIRGSGEIGYRADVEFANMCMAGQLKLYLYELQREQFNIHTKGETIRNYNPEKRWDKYKKSKIEVREFDLVPKVQPEKQEGWRELSVNTRRILKTLGYYFSDGNEHYSCPVCGIDVVRLDQLLSERTFTKEELRLLDAYLSLALPEYNDFDKETKMHRDMDKLHKILEKISKLLKEEE